MEEADACRSGPLLLASGCFHSTSLQPFPQVSSLFLTPTRLSTICASSLSHDHIALITNIRFRVLEGATFLSLTDVTFIHITGNRFTEARNINKSTTHPIVSHNNILLSHKDFLLLIVKKPFQSQIWYLTPLQILLSFGWHATYFAIPLFSTFYFANEGSRA